MYDRLEQPGGGGRGIAEMCDDIAVERMVVLIDENDKK